MPCCTWPPSTAPPAIPTPTTASQRRRAPSGCSRPRRARACAASCTPPRWACTATWSSPPADETAPLRARGHLPGDQGGSGGPGPATSAASAALPVAVVRPGAIYGPGETRLLKLFRAIARGRYAMVGSAAPFYHPVYIDDLVDGFLLALERPEAVGEAFILAGPRYVSQGELAAMIARAHRGAGAALPRPGRARSSWAGDSSRRSASRSASSRRSTGGASTSGRRAAPSPSRRRGVCSATRRKVDLEEGIARTAAWYREAGWL